MQYALCFFDGKKLWLLSKRSRLKFVGSCFVEKIQRVALHLVQSTSSVLQVPQLNGDQLQGADFWLDMLSSQSPFIIVLSICHCKLFWMMVGSHLDLCVSFLLPGICREQQSGTCVLIMELCDLIQVMLFFFNL